MVDLEKDFKKLVKKRKLRIGRILTPLIMIMVIVSFIYFMKDVGMDNKIIITVINNKDCDYCSDPSSIAEMIKNDKNVDVSEVLELDYRDEKAKRLLEITRAKTVPVIMIEGNTFTKTSVYKNMTPEDFEEYGNKYILVNFLPPFTNIENGEIIGKVNAIKLTDKSCNKCADINHMIIKFRELGIYMNDAKNIDISSDDGKVLIEKYDIEKVPVLILDQNMGLYPHIVNSWETLGSIEEDGTYIVRKTLPPYKILESNEIKGLITITYIVDKTCTECFDPKKIKERIMRIMPQYKEEIILDISDIKTQQLVIDKGIEHVPTVILSNDVNEYPLFENFFGNIFEKQDDESFIFKGYDKIQGVSYKSLRTNKITNN